MGLLLLLLVLCVLVCARALSLEDLSDDQVVQTVQQMDEATLLEVIRAQGYDVDTSKGEVSRQDLVEAAHALVLEERHRLREIRDQQPEAAAAAATTNATPMDIASTATPDAGKERNQSQNQHNGGDDVDEDDEEEEAEATEAVMQESPTKAEEYEQTRRGINALPDDAGVLELMRAQIAADLAPFLALIPDHVKAQIVQQSKELGSRLKVAIRGAAGPMFKVASRGFVLAGKGMIVLGAKMNNFADGINRDGVHPAAAVAGQQQLLGGGEEAPRSEQQRMRTSAVRGSAPAVSAAATVGTTTQSPSKELQEQEQEEEEQASLESLLEEDDEDALIELQ